ncbi:MAG TPA: PEP-CTERM sorting domain-containing protein, partial [Rhodocyclaceae bacterium]|nr:PEP-CTERM sorting domain-containing protein [Rhodocyclaceae bacterium]
AGNHVIETYGLEDCCDGAQEAQFMAPGATFWTTFSTDDGLDRVRETPEPGSLLLASLGLLAMALGRRRS